MGNRVHVVKQREKYGDTERFNWKGGFFKDLLDSLGCDVCGEEYSSRFWVTKEEYKNAMKTLKSYINDKGRVEFYGYTRTEIKEYITALDYTAEEILRIMELFLEESDKESEQIMFVSW